jgi:hypothetical protein
MPFLTPAILKRIVRSGRSATGNRSITGFVKQLNPRRNPAMADLLKDGDSKKMNSTSARLAMSSVNVVSVQMRAVYQSATG